MENFIFCAASKFLCAGRIEESAFAFIFLR